MNDLLDFIKGNLFFRILAYFLIGFIALQFIAAVIALFVALFWLSHVL